MLKVSFFQDLPKYNDIQRNLDSVKDLLKNNNENILKSDLVVFPEYIFSGPLNLEGFEEYKKQLNNISLQDELTQLTRLYPDTTFVFGSAVLPRQQEYRNISLILKNGELLSEYNKKALIYNENYICKADGNYPIFTIGDYKIGIAICWDIILPEVFRHFTGKVDLVVIPSFWGLGGNALQAQYSFSLEKKYYSQLCIARSYENSFALLFVNSVGQYKSTFYNDRMMGGSLAIMPPLGEIYSTNDKNPDKLHQVSLDFEPLKKYREFYATDKDYAYYKTKNIF